MNTSYRQSRGLIYFIVAAFCHFLLQPQIGTFAHTHAGDEVPHSHPQFSFSSFAHHDQTPSHTHHAHAHASTHHHSRGEHTHHANDHVHTLRVKQKPDSRLSLRSASSSRSHWHTTTTVHLPGMPVAFVWTMFLTQTSESSPLQQQFPWTSRTTYHSRAPPLLS